MHHRLQHRFSVRRAASVVPAACLGLLAACSQGVDGGTLGFSASASATATATAGQTNGTTAAGTTAASGSGDTSGSSGGRGSTGAVTGTTMGSSTGDGSSTTDTSSTSGSTGGLDTSGGSSTGGLGGSSGPGSTGGTTGGGACNVAILLDFSTCPGGFTTGKANVLSSPSSWACGDPVIGPVGTGMWGTNLYGDYNDDESSYLESPSISLADCQGKTVSVRVRHWYDIESGWDGGNIQISTDGGATWQVVMPTGHPYDDPSIVASYSPPAGQPGFSGYDGVWRESFVDLTPYIGSSDVRMRFVFGSDSSITYAGWYIDEVEVLVQ